MNNELGSAHTQTLALFSKEGTAAAGGVLSNLIFAGTKHPSRGGNAGL